MAERGISKEQVTRAIRHPDKQGPAKRADATRFEKKLSPKKRLIVIAEEHVREFWVITAWRK